MGHNKKKYIWQKSKWPNLTWDSEKLLQSLGEARRYQGTILAKADEIGLEAFSDLVVEEVFSTSAIEGETLDKPTIRSSVARRLGLPTAGLPEETRPIDGLVEILMDATTNYSTSLTFKRLHGWHAALFPTGYSGIQKIVVANWRKGKEAMQVVSGRLGEEKVHYEAPPSDQVSREMKSFLAWYNNPPLNLDGLIRAGIVHFLFDLFDMQFICIAQQEKTISFFFG